MARIRPASSEAKTFFPELERTKDIPQTLTDAIEIETFVGKKERLRLQEIVLLLGVASVAVLIRLLGITQPYVDAWSYKQGTIAMIAENFYRNGFNIFYPQINWAGRAPGYIGTEFPLVPFIASLLYVPFGVQEWIGRSVSLLFFIPSLPFLYLLVKKTSNERSAAFAAAIYALMPLSIFASRSFMSDMTSLSFSIVALYLFSEWLERSDRFGLLIGASLTTAVAILVKAPAVIIGLPLLYMAWEEHGPQLFRRPKLWIFAILSLVFPVAWYLHAYEITLAYSPHKFAGSEGLALADLALYTNIVEQVFTQTLTPLTSAGLLVGLFIPAPKKHGRIFHWWLLALSLFVIIAGFGNRHAWYQLPVVPIAAALASRVLDLALGRVRDLTGSHRAEFAAAGIFFAVLGLVSYIYLKPLYEPSGIALWKAGRAIDSIAPRNALIVFVIDGDSSAIYYSKRKGWNAFDESDWSNPLDSDQAITGLEKLRKRGGRYLVFTQYSVWWFDYYKDFREYLDSHYQRVRDTADYVIYDLTPVA